MAVFLPWINLIGLVIVIGCMRQAKREFDRRGRRS